MSGGSPKRADRLLRRWITALGLLFATIVILVAGILIAIDLGWERDRLVALVVERAREQLGLDVEVEAAVGRLSRGIELQNVRLGEADEPLARLASVRIRWNLRQLLMGEHSIVDSIRIEGWSLELRRSQKGEWVGFDEWIARLSSSESSGAETAEPSGRGAGLWIRRLELAEGEVGVIVERRPSVPRAPPVAAEGPLRARLRARGQARDLRLGAADPFRLRRARLEARLVGIDTGVPEYDRDAAGSFAMRLVEDRLESLEAELLAPGLELRGQASGRVDHLDRLVVEIAASDLAPLSDWLQTSAPLDGKLEATLDLHGPPTELVGTARVVARGLQIEGFEARELDLDLVLDSPISELLVDPWATQATLRARARGLDPGSLDRDLLPPGAAELEVDGFAAQGLFELRRGRLAMAGLELEATGRGSRTRIDGLDLRFILEDVGPWLRSGRVDLALTGGLGGEAHLAGSFARPVGRVDLRSDGLTLRGRPLGVVALQIERQANEPLALELAVGPTSRPHLAGRARVDLARQRVDFGGSGQAEPWMALLDGAPAIRAHFATEGFFERTPQGPRLGFELRARDTVVADEPLGQLEIAAMTPSPGELEIAKLELAGEAGRVSLTQPARLRLGGDGAWSLAQARLQLALAEEPTSPASMALGASGRRTRPESFEARVEQLPLALANRFRPEGPRLGGRLSGHARWRRVRVPDWTQGELEWLGPRLGELQLDRLVTRWTSSASEVDLSLETAVAGLSPLVVHGRIALPEHMEDIFDLASVEGVALRAELDDWDLAALEALSPRWMRGIEGRIHGSIALERDALGLRLDGQATIAQGGFTVPLLRQRFTPVEALVTLADRRISIDSLRVGRPDASATMVGSIALQEVGSPALDFDLRFDHLPVSRSSVAWLDLVGELRLSGELDRPILRGDLTVADGRIGVPRARDPISKEIRIASQLGSTSITEEQGPRYEPLAAADVDVALSVPGSTRVRGREMNLFVEGEARFLKPGPEPLRILGEARVVNGTYSFQGRRFRVRRGRVLMTGGELFDPLLDVEATLPVADIVAIVEVTGPLSEPIVRLHSEPPHSEQDVLAYVLFGRPAEEIGATGESRFDAAAARLAAGVAEAELRDILGDAMPIDTIEITADEEGEVSELGFGKYVGPRLYLRYSHVLGDEPADRVGAEYRINETFSVGNSVSTTGDVGIDLILRHDF